MSNRQVVERFLEAMVADDLDAQDAVIHDDYVVRNPQSGGRGKKEYAKEAQVVAEAGPDGMPATAQDGNGAGEAPWRRRKRR